MAQLKMYWLKGTEYTEYELPEGYSVSNYKTEADKLCWVECCKNGLVADDADEKAFDESILGRKEIVPEKDVFFLDYMGEHIGTVTAYVHEKEGFGDMHMVGIKTEFRGKGLAKFLNLITFHRLADEDIPFIELTTDEWRKGAVKSYLNGGFLPVNYDVGMEERWRSVITEYGIESVQMLNEDGTPYQVIYREKSE